MSLAIAKKPAHDNTFNKKRDSVHNALKNSQTIHTTPQVPIIQRKPVCPCDGGCPRCTGIQPKLKIGQPNDIYEQEADRVADQVMRMPEPNVQRKAGCSSCGEIDEEEQIQTKPIGDQITPLVQRKEEETGIDEEEEEEPVQSKSLNNKAPLVTTDFQSKIQSLRGGGHPLLVSTRAYFEPRFGADFSKVRVHNDTRAANVARSVNARAFTLGRNVVFGAGEYSPDALAGRKLLAHELTHVVQQNSGPTLFPRGKNSENTVTNSQKLSIVSPELSELCPELPGEKVQLQPISPLIQCQKGHIETVLHSYLAGQPVFAQLSALRPAPVRLVQRDADLGGGQQTPESSPAAQDAEAPSKTTSDAQLGKKPIVLEARLAEPSRPVPKGDVDVASEGGEDAFGVTIAGVSKPSQLFGTADQEGPEVDIRDGQYVARPTLKLEVKWDTLKGVGPHNEKNISGPSDPDIDSGNYTKVADDLTPDTLGEPPRNSYWCQDLTEKHERYHVNEAFVLRDLGAEKWKNVVDSKQAGNPDEVRKVVRKEWVPHYAEYTRAGSEDGGAEQRAYAAGKKDYDERAAAIRKKGDAGGYPGIKQEIYVVQIGDWLAKIAKMHGVTLAELQRANPGLGPPNRSWDRIYPGDKVLIPRPGLPVPPGTVPPGELPACLFMSDEAQTFFGSRTPGILASFAIPGLTCQLKGMSKDKLELARVRKVKLTVSPGKVNRGWKNGKVFINGVIFAEASAEVGSGVTPANNFAFGFIQVCRPYDIVRATYRKKGAAAGTGNDLDWNASSHIRSKMPAIDAQSKSAFYHVIPEKLKTVKTKGVYAYKNKTVETVTPSKGKVPPVTFHDKPQQTFLDSKSKGSSIYDITGFSWQAHFFTAYVVKLPSGKIEPLATFYWRVEDCLASRASAIGPGKSKAVANVTNTPVRYCFKHHCDRGEPGFDKAGTKPKASQTCLGLTSGASKATPNKGPDDFKIKC